MQKLAWTLKDAKHDFAAVEVAVLPPFTDLRSVQTLVDADKLELGYGAQDVSAHTSGAYTGEISPLFLAKLGVTYVDDRPLGAPRVPQRDRRAGQRQGARRRSARASSPILCVGEVLEIRKAGEHVAAHARAARRRPRGRHGRAGADDRRRVRARLGHRHRRDGDAGGRAGGVPRPSAPASPSCTTPRRPTRSASCTAVR